MAFNLFKINIPLSCIIPNNTKLVLLEVAPAVEYKDGIKTDKHNGYKYTLVELNTYEKFIVKVFNLDNPIPPSILTETKGPVYVALHDCYAKLYKDTSSSFALTFSARAITLEKS